MFARVVTSANKGSDRGALCVTECNSPKMRRWSVAASLLFSNQSIADEIIDVGPPPHPNFLSRPSSLKCHFTFLVAWTFDAAPRHLTPRSVSASPPSHPPFRRRRYLCLWSTPVSLVGVDIIRLRSLDDFKEQETSVLLLRWRSPTLSRRTSK